MSVSKKIRVETFIAIHALEVHRRNLIEMGTQDTLDEWKRWVKDWEEGGPAYTIRVNDEIAVCCGVHVNSGHLGECWMIQTSTFYANVKEVFKVMKGLIGKIIEDHKIEVIALVELDFWKGKTFVLHLGFEEEGNFTLFRRKR